MKNFQKGFASTVLIIVIVMIAGIVGYFVTNQQKSPPARISNPISITPSLSQPLRNGPVARRPTPETPSTNASNTVPTIPETITPSAPQNTLITVPVRIHLLQSSHTQVQTTTTPDEVIAMFDGPDGVNKRYWNQYGINLKIESIVKDSATNDSGFAQAIASGSRPSNQQFVGLVPYQNSLLSLDFVVVHDFGTTGGGLTLPRKGVMLVPESSVKGSGSKIMTFGFAHEFGHTLLGGPHFSNSIDPYNIMAVGDPTVYNPFDKTHLTTEQIVTAQAQARKGTPNVTRVVE